ncbi:MAG: [protein-PII] uridylyltransferase [Chlamydiae bacterium]|nr:[protein-PII] uridylyltransferase [Chlamydiota bacterium]MBI3277565.1 [protein-PII] uridylyltransferase [Chlamydiota bacterium]
MKINPEKVLKHAESKLKVLPESGDQDWLSLYKKFLHIEMQRLLMAHRYGVSGLEIAQDRSYLMDILIQHIFELACKEEELQQGRPQTTAPFSLVALGGYGRATLNPFSDIDILFLLKEKSNALEDRMIKPILYLLWDSGLKVGHAVRTIPETVEEGRRDFKSRTAMMEARFITGDEILFQKFKENFSRNCLAYDLSSYISFKLEEIRLRHEKYQGTVYLQEPHIKEGVGGLRDLSSILWLYQALSRYNHFETLLENGILSQKDFKMIQKSLDFLHRVRNELHFLTGKCFDILSLNLQVKVAQNLGYQDTPLLKMSEGFMKDYYLHARNVDLVVRALLAREEIQTQLKIQFPEKFIHRHGFSFTTEEIFPGTNPNLFREEPQKLFELFLYCAQGKYQLSQSLIQQIRENLHLVDKKVRTSPQIRDIFVNLMGYEGEIIPALRAMHTCGLLGKYIPEFGRATCLVQHDFYHKYTLDEHTLKALSFMDDLKKTQDPRLSGFSEILKKVQDREVLFLAIFFHDIGKIQGHNHSVTGAKITQEILKKLEYDSEKRERIRLLVEHHLVMSHLSQRRDLSEEKVIVDFSKKVVDVENLKMLVLLTYCDWRATSDEVWNEWRESLLWELFYKTKRYLEEKVILLPSEIEAIKNSYVEILTRKNIPPDETLQHLEMLPLNYLQSYRPETILEHLKIIAEIKKEDPKILWEFLEKTNTTELTVCTKDHIGLFSELTGVIASQEVNILSANIFTRKDGIILDKFSLENRYEKGILPERTRKKIEEGMKQIIQKQITIEGLLKSKAYSQREKPVSISSPLIKFDNESSLGTTIVEIQADDQIGLLYKITRTFSKLGLNIHLSKIATEKNQALDIFYLTDPKGAKISQPQVQKTISEEIEKAIRETLF